MQDSTQFPFRSVLNLRLLMEYWEDRIKRDNIKAFTTGILEYIESTPELKEPLVDLAILEKHRPFIELLLSAVVPQATNNKDLVAAVFPFEFRPIYSSHAMQREVDLANFSQKVKANLPGNSVETGKIVKACLMILEKFYDTDTYRDRPVLLTLTDEKTGLDKVYKVEINHEFCEIVALEEPKPIDKQVIKFLMEKTYDVDLWLQYIKPENFEFHGFIVMRLVDVTEQEMLSSIKYDLLGKNAVVGKESFGIIQHKLRSLFNIPDIRLGIAYSDPDNNLILNNANENCWKSLADTCTATDPCGNYEGSLYERSWMEKRHITVEDLNAYPFRSKVEDALLANGINNILLAPLIDEGETIGMLELATPSVGKLNPVSAHKVEAVLPMFTAAVKRVKEEMSTEVRAIIQEECTAIHPTVQWRFFKAGVNLMNKRRKGEKSLMEEIVFKDVYPLFGMADIRNSSLERNAAIQKDLEQNLTLARNLLEKINAVKKLPLLEEVIFKTERQRQSITRGLASGDESDVLEFLKSEINPLIEHFTHYPEFASAITSYREALDAETGIVYKRRKAFEESLSKINTVISQYLDEAEHEAQQMFPHYFEKYKTDGIEYTLYLGSSLVEDKKFDPFYLRNFHLWQLLTMCEIHRKIEALKPSLKTKLDITQLVLVHDQPISIRFRPDEKQFDVDGAYDIRYEIIKKRIDKAYIKNSSERLTQPGKIAIVYNHTKTEDEFRRYFEYLTVRNLVTGSIETLELEELPGASGLRALRFQIATQNKTAKELSNINLLTDIDSIIRMH
ncbi:MAG TPA: GAF domain-containing protein [Ohtaekwangia sp.]|nr:GAF domain-containing protein [Ohtaekwangia sp.]